MLKKLDIAVKIISVIVRQFLPNPFIPLEGRLNLSKGFTDGINLFAGLVLVPITYFIVRLFYSRGEENVAKGSFLFVVFYLVHTAILYVLSMTGFALWAVIIIPVAYIVLLTRLAILYNR